jgi:hypothetical protein
MRYGCPAGAERNLRRHVGRRPSPVTTMILPFLSTSTRSTLRPASQGLDGAGHIALAGASVIRLARSRPARPPKAVASVILGSLDCDVSISGDAMRHVSAETRRRGRCACPSTAPATSRSAFLLWHEGDVVSRANPDQQLFDLGLVLGDLAAQPLDLVGGLGPEDLRRRLSV